MTVTSISSTSTPSWHYWVASNADREPRTEIGQQPIPSAVLRMNPNDRRCLSGESFVRYVYG